jgi:hypothetical protein
MKIILKWCTCGGKAAAKEQDFKKVVVDVECPYDSEKYLREMANQIVAGLSGLYYCDASVSIETRTEYRRGHLDEI